ncbi:MAG: PEP-CTERM sorting domain-containing protein [Cyanobacteria bacterium P01_G01_bin.38]
MSKTSAYIRPFYTATLSCAATVSVMVAPASAGEYDYFPITAGDRSIRYLLDSNAQGDQIGSVPSLPAGSLEGFLISDTGETTFWSNPDKLTYPTAINDSRQVVGVNIPLAGGLPEGFERDANGIENPFNFPGGLGTVPFGINNSGVYSGFYITPAGRRGFVSAPSVSLFRSVEFPGAAETQLFGLNNAGQVGGAYYDQQGQAFPFIYDINSESFNLLPQPTPGNYVVTSLNDAGDAVIFGLRDMTEGYADRNSFVFNAARGTTTELLYPGALETYGYDIRSDRSVIGYYLNPDDTYGGFLAAAAVPEPSSLAVLALVPGLFWLRRRT